MCKHRLPLSVCVAQPLLMLAACLLWAASAQGVLISRYDFEDFATPTTAEDPVSGHDGTIVGGAGFFPDSRIGLASMRFNGSSDIRVPYHGDFDKSTFSVSAWVKIASEQGNGGILGTRFGGDTTFDVKVRATDVHGDVGSGGGWINTGVDIRATDTGSNGQGGDLPLNTWNMITYVIDDSAKQFRLYIDDDLKRTIGYSGTPRMMKPGQEMRIGNSYGSEFLNGLLDDMRIYDHALTQSEITALASQPALARVTIADLYNTGVDDFGVALVGGNPSAKVNDPHYDVLQVAGSPVSPYDAFVAEVDGFPIGPWPANDADSRWIDANGNEDSNGGGGQYTYRTTFTLPSYADLQTVLISGMWASDNAAGDILINGISTGQGNSDWGTLVPFVVSSGFVYGTNTLDFVFTNQGAGPTGLRIDDIMGSFVVIPEPSTLLIWSLLAGLGLAAGRRRRKR